MRRCSYFDISVCLCKMFRLKRSFCVCVDVPVLSVFMKGLRQPSVLGYVCVSVSRDMQYQAPFSYQSL